MNLRPLLQNPLYLLGSAAVAGAVIAAVAALPPRMPEVPPAAQKPQTIEAPGADRLNERIPDTGIVLEKHLFVPGRKATGQNSFPDLIVKGVYLGDEKSVIFSLKSKPQVNLRVWLGEVESTLSSITDPRDPRQSLVTFLREWPIKEVSQKSVTFEHFITGEVETYDVDYVAEKKVDDDAERGYGQGIMPQEDVASKASKEKAGNQNRRQAEGQMAGAPPMPPGGAQFMADRVSSMLRNLDPQQQRQFLQRLNQQAGGQTSGTATQNATTKKNNSKNRTTKK